MNPDEAPDQWPPSTKSSEEAFEQWWVNIREPERDNESCTRSASHLGNAKEEARIAWNQAMISSAPTPPVLPVGDENRRLGPARDMTDREISAELEALEREWDDMFNDPDFEGHSGSPGEWMAERMNEIVTEQKRRSTLTKAEEPSQ